MADGAQPSCGRRSAAASLLVVAVALLLEAVASLLSGAGDLPSRPPRASVKKNVRRRSSYKSPRGAPAEESATPRLHELLRELGQQLRPRADAAGRVMVSAVNSDFARTAVFANWWCSVQKVGAAGHAVVGAVNQAAVPQLQGLGVHAGGGGDWSHMQKLKPLLTLAGLIAGLGVLMLDADIVFFRNPLDYIAERLTAAVKGIADGPSGEQSPDRAVPSVLCQRDGGRPEGCCTGFIYFTPSADVLRRVWQWVGILQQLLLVDCGLPNNMFCHLPEQHMWNRYAALGRQFGSTGRHRKERIVVPKEWYSLPTVPAGNASAVATLLIPDADVTSTTVAELERYQPVPNGSIWRIRASARPLPVRQPRVALHAAGGAGPWGSASRGKENALRAHRAWLPHRISRGWRCDSAPEWPPSAELVWDPRCAAVPGCRRCTWCSSAVSPRRAAEFYTALNGTALCEASKLAGRGVAAGGAAEDDYCPLPPLPAEYLRLRYRHLVVPPGMFVI
eukprot:TRINITY_DN14278_c0_g2_i2.p1 TRINITY_DN14278_c0_g2~~TRINITY_DN14278_c0_g2_i2.p1  ORF type:complete len:524 (+),score=75.22 TRINITY_DN14278_c0_g2_i2:60-1574(+)